MPLLILGYPGSGKSLLSEILAAQLAYPSYTTIRVELRDIDSDADPQTQIQQQIGKDTGRSVNWVQLSDGLSANPPLVILDGCDELLQASGKVHADYIEKVRRFQYREALDGRPVRIIITSRMTLIDKAYVPIGTTVVRLLDFNRARQDAWIEVWNRYNADYFRDSHTNPFTLPPSPQLAILAVQPLLLLMLAIYDSDGNQLSTEPNLDQTALYNSLLRRFIVRERSKGDEGLAFIALTEPEREEIVEADMTRLGVAAMSMFNRQAVHIMKNQLNDDMSYYDLKQKISTTAGRPLTQADLLLGSFFFIHESKSGSGNEPVLSRAPESTAFEFLHNTFGEFLAADFILRQVCKEAQAIRAMNASTVLQARLPEYLTTMSEEWFACLKHTLLDTRPVIVQMLREWAPHMAVRQGLPRSDLDSALRAIVTSQLKAILDGEDIINMSPRGKESPYKKLPLLGHLAIYSLNLIVLIVVLSEEAVALSDSELGSHKNSGTAWDQLIALWRSWMSPENLLGAAEIFRADRLNGQVLLSLTSKVGELLAGTARDYPDGLRVAYLAARGLGDYPAAALAGLALTQFSRLDDDVLNDIGKSLTVFGGGVGHILDPTRLKSDEAVPVSDISRLSRRTAVIGSSMTRVPGGVTTQSDHMSVYSSQVYEVLSKTPLRQDLHGQFAISASYIEELLHIGSRYDIELLVAVRNHIEPRWLPTLLRSMGIKANVRSGSVLKVRSGSVLKNRPQRAGASWPTILHSTCAAPVLRAAIGSCAKKVLRDVAVSIRSECHGEVVRAFDAETAALVAVLGFYGDQRNTCELGLRTLTQHFASGSWKIIDVPMPTFGWLTEVLIDGGSKSSAYRSEIVAHASKQVWISNRNWKGSAGGRCRLKLWCIVFGWE